MRTALGLAVATWGCASTSVAHRESPPSPAPQQVQEPAEKKEPPRSPRAHRLAKASRKPGGNRSNRTDVKAQRLTPDTKPSPALDAALRRFMAVRMVHPRKRPAQMPLETEQLWHEFLGHVERAAARATGEGAEQAELSLFIRARVCMEAELQQDRRRYRTVPEDLVQRWRDALAMVDERVQMLREDSSGFALGEDQPAKGPLVLRFPVRLVHVTSHFGHRRDPVQRHRSRFHSGVDLGGAEGMLVSAAGPGVVAYADWQGANGNHVIVVHTWGYRTYYSHLSKVFVQQGMVVQEGTPLGMVGDTGRSTGPHLHFAVSRQGTFLDPLQLLNIPLGAEEVPSS